MKKINLGLSLAFLLFAQPFWAQEAPKLTRFTTGFEIGSGIAGQDCCQDNYGYYNIGAQMAYRIFRQVSVEGSLRYLHLEGKLYGYSNITQFELGGFQSWNNLNLMLGPSLHFATRKHREWSFLPKAGIMMTNIVHEIRNYGKPYLKQSYKPSFQLAYEIQLRTSWWLTERLAVESGLGYFLSNSNNLDPKSGAETVPLPDSFRQELINNDSPMHALNLSLGLRFRL